MRNLCLVALLALPMTPAMADVTVTGPKGGMIERTQDCVRGEGSAECTLEVLRTGPEGKTSTKLRLRSIEPGRALTEVTLTGPRGETRFRTRETTWGN